MSKVLVDRELLELAAKAIEKHHSSLAWPIAEELRKILATPIPDAVEVVEVSCVLWKRDSMDLPPLTEWLVSSFKYKDGEGFMTVAQHNRIVSGFDSLMAAKRARVNAFLHERQNELLVNMLAGIPSAEASAYDEEKERALFEVDKPHRNYARSNIGYYMLASTEDEWQGWLACAKARAKAV
jgi:hypothetical protein